MEDRQRSKLQGRVAAITGGARGIGRAIAAALAAKGMRVAIGDRDFPLAQETAHAIGASAHAYRVDVCDQQSFMDFIAGAERDLGPLYALCNNAGIMLTGLYANEDAVATQAMIDVNIGGVATGCRIVLPGMLQRGEGHIVNLGSSASKVGYPGIATYSATKFYVFGLSEALRAELRGTGVHVSCVMPGFVDTDLTAGVRDTALLKRISPREVAAAVATTLERPAFEVYAPSSIGAMNAIMALVPRSLREAMIRLIGADRILLHADPAARALYTDRASKSGRPSH